MRLRTVWLVIAAVNVLWAAAFFGYVKRSTVPVMRGGEIVGGEQKVAVADKNSAAPKTTPKTSPPNQGTNAAPSNVVATPTNTAPAGRQFGWQDVTNDIYKDYIARLRAAGCPEK